MLTSKLEARPRHLARDETVFVLLIGVVSAVLYAVVYFAQWEIFENGLSGRVAEARALGEPPNGILLAVQLAAYFGATVAVFALYVWLLLRVHSSERLSRRARYLALFSPVVLNLSLLAGRPHLSIDVLSYIAHGFIDNAPGGNPYVDRAGEAADTPLHPQLASLGWRPVHGVTPYGPLWTNIESLVMSGTGDAVTAMHLLKLVVVTASLGSGWVIWKILGHVRPSYQLLGTVAYLWNPVVIVEFAGEGHNDALMIFLVLVAVWLTVRARVVSGALTLFAGVLVKYLPLILAPAQMVYLWRRSRRRSQLLLYLLLASVGALVLAALLYLPLWAGQETFAGVRESGRPGWWASAPGALFVSLVQVIPGPEALLIASVVPSALFALYLSARSWNVRDDDSFLAACADIALAYTLVASARYWPWYVALPIALMALSPNRAYLSIVVVLSLCSRLVAPINHVQGNGFLTFHQNLVLTTLVGVLIPLVTVVVVKGWHRDLRGWKERIRPTAARA